MAPRWKGRAAEAQALANPMSKITSNLQASLLQSDARGSLSGSSVLLPVQPQQAELLARACVGRPIITADKEKQWFQLSLEEAFYLTHHLECLKITNNNHHQGTTSSIPELWQCMNSEISSFPHYYKAYFHLRTKNWVVRPGSQYGVDFVAYRHHPSLVHSEYAVLVVLSEGESSSSSSSYGGSVNGRLMVWSDLYCTIRLCGSVAKTLLVLTIDRNGHGDGDVSPTDLDGYSVEERSIRRWSPEQNREEQMAAANGTKKLKEGRANGERGFDDGNACGGASSNDACGGESSNDVDMPTTQIDEAVMDEILGETVKKQPSSVVSG